MAKTQSDAADELHEAYLDSLASRGRILLAVLEARRAGLSWTEIGDKLSMTRQAAHQQFADYVERVEQGKAPGFRPT